MAKYTIYSNDKILKHSKNTKFIKYNDSDMLAQITYKGVTNTNIPTYKCWIMTGYAPYLVVKVYIVNNQPLVKADDVKLWYLANGYKTRDVCIRKFNKGATFDTCFNLHDTNVDTTFHNAFNLLRYYFNEANPTKLSLMAKKRELSKKISKIDKVLGKVNK